MAWTGIRARWLAVSVWLMCGLAWAHAAGCATAGTQLELDRCAGDDFATADAALNLTYTDIAARLHGRDDTRKRLVTAERAWLAFRNVECEFETSSSVGGSIHPMVESECRTALTKARTEALRHLLTCAEGDLSCPLPPK